MAAIANPAHRGNCPGGMADCPQPEAAVQPRAGATLQAYFAAMASLASLHIYPLKSCAPLAVHSAEVRARGLRHDRRWMLVDGNGRFVSGRELPRLTLLHAEPLPDGLRLAIADMPAIDVPLPAAETTRIDVSLWKSAFSAAHCGEQADRWLSDALQRPLRLVHMDALAARPISSSRALPGDQVGFADAFPLLLISQAALDGLNERLARPAKMSQFRPNLVVDGVDAHAEDGWRRIRIGAVEFEVAKPCGRCVFTTVDPATGSRDPAGEPLRSLIAYRRGSDGVTFGQYLTPRGHGVVQQGDAVEVLEAG
jgi:uncharacterized protein